MGGGAMTDDPKSVKTAKRHYLNNDAALDQTALGDDLVTTSDRAAVITIAALLDTALARATTLKMHITSDAEYFRAFENGGPLSTFSARIDMAYWLKVIDQDTREQLHTVRELRNICAHSRLPISLNEPRLVAVARRVVHPRGLFKVIPDDPQGVRKALVSEALHLHGVILMGRDEALKATRESFTRHGVESPV